MKLKILILLSLLISIVLVSQEIENEHAVLTERISIVKKELQRRKFYLTPKKYNFLLMNKQTVQFILVKQGRMFSTGIGVAADDKSKGYKIAIYELHDIKDYSSKELLEKFSVTDKIFLREIHDTSNFYLIEIEMATDFSEGSVVQLLHGFSAIQLNVINKKPPQNIDINAGLCDFGNCGIIRRMDWGK
ncbi:MAG: hypothetical protein KBF99_05615 [Leptospiraceae bacterium]|nr:hypothetical protein [Leptospiraceae bacterium]MBP9162637.1 hypothetical protein [Leptospiraceae bacterium]